MPLSERERQILDEIEKNLYAEDPRFARDVAHRSRFDASRRLKTGALIFLVGFAGLIAFFVSQMILVGVLAFAVMVGGIVIVAGSLRDMAEGLRPQGPGPRERAKSTLSRWERRLRERYKRI